MRAEKFFERLWDGYVRIAPRAASIRQRLEARGEVVVDDHVALRTFADSPIDIAHLEPQILSMGYHAFEDYTFEGKNLSARAYVCQERPRIFLSELKRCELSPDVQVTLQAVVDQIPPNAADGMAVFWSGRLWDAITSSEYEKLSAESEYAAWLSAIGMCANHFTVAVNALKTFPSLATLLDWVEAEGFPLNVSGGRIKGDPNVLLCQGSTLADRKEVQFADRCYAIPTCYYEFAQRFRTAEGALYDGFVTSSADRIFESTNR